MLKNKTTEEQSGAQRGRQVIEEAAWLLRQLRFSQHHGAYAEGQQVAISIDPRWNTDNETMQVLITCYAFAHRRAEWAKLPMHILPEGGRAGVYAIARLNARGQVTYLNPAAERLTGWATSSALLEPVTHVFQPLAEDDPVHDVGQVAGVAFAGRLHRLRDLGGAHSLSAGGHPQGLASSKPCATEWYESHVWLLRKDG